MPKLEQISVLPAAAIELLEAVGYTEVGDLDQADTNELIVELVEANKLLGVMPGEPTKQSLEEWQKLANDHVMGRKEILQERQQESGKAKSEEPTTDKIGDPHKHEDRDSSPVIVNLEQNSGILEMLAVSPEAESLDAAALHDRKLSFSDMPDGLLLSRYEGDMKINIMTTLGRADTHLRRRDEVKRIGLKASRIRSFDDLRHGNHHVKPLQGGMPNEEISQDKNLNAGIDPESRRFIKGVPHSDPKSIYLAALAVFFLAVCSVLNLVGVPALLIVQKHLGHERLLVWVMALFAVLLVSILCYLLLGLRAHCKICSQRPLMPKKCVKHKKAHHVRGIGYILPTALQVLFFKWFYCTYW